MPGNFSLKSLGIGSLTTVPTAIYVVPGSTSAIIKAVTLVNTASTSVTVNLALNNGSASGYILPPSYGMDAFGMIESTPNLTMGPADSISAWAGSNAVVQFTIHGTEET